MRIKKEICFYFNSDNQKEQNSTSIIFPKNEGIINKDYNNSNDERNSLLLNKDNNKNENQIKEKNDNEINNISNNFENNDNMLNNYLNNNNTTNKNEMINMNNKFDSDIVNPLDQNNLSEQKSIDSMKNEEMIEKSEDEIKEKEESNKNNKSISIDIANEFIYRLIKHNPNFKSFEEIEEMNDYVHLTAINTLYQIPESKDSYYKINPEELDDNSTSSFLNIKPRAKEFGIKLKGLIESGEVSIYAKNVEILILVNIFKICNSNHETKGAIIINIVFPKERYPPRYDLIKLDEVYENADKITKAFKLGKVYAAAIILECIIKKGIKHILAGPISAAIGFSD